MKRDCDKLLTNLRNRTYKHATSIGLPVNEQDVFVISSHLLSGEKQPQELRLEGPLDEERFFTRIKGLPADLLTGKAAGDKAVAVKNGA